MINPFSKFQTSTDRSGDPEVVDLSEIDLDFAVEEAFRQDALEAPKVINPIVSVPAEPGDLGGLELFKGLSDEELTELAPLCQSTRVIPGYVLYPTGRFNTKLYFVLEGQMRLYKAGGEKRPCGIVDIGQSCGLSSALTMQAAEHSL